MDEGRRIKPSYLPNISELGDCHPDGHVFKFYAGEKTGYCIYCGELRHLDAYATKTYMKPGGKEAST
jgi:hypothetical protein